MKNLTEKQRSILEFIISFTKDHGFPPSLAETGEHFGILVPAVKGHLLAIEKKGHIRLNPQKPRGIEIFSLKPREGTLVPVLGAIRAGMPVIAVEDVEAHIMLDRSLFPDDDIFCLRVAGDSMKNAGILNGDYVVVRKQDAVGNGVIGVVMVGDEATVKRIMPDGEHVILKPENETMEPIICRADETHIIGKVLGVIRRL